jgi:RNA polymerase sigma-70 factor, ECF subfamily
MAPTWPEALPSCSGRQAEQVATVAGPRPGLRTRRARPAAASDLDLVRGMRGGDAPAFAQLVDRYHGPLLRLAQAFLRDRAAAEEVVQDTWVGVLEGLPSFEGRSSLKTWLFRILSNRARSRRGREWRSIPFSALEPAGGPAGPSVEPERFDASGAWTDPPGRWEEESPDSLLLRAEVRAALEAAIEDLPPGQRAVLVLRDVEGLEPEAIRQVLDLGASNQRVLLHRARSKVRRALEVHFRGG